MRCFARRVDAGRSFLAGLFLLLYGAPAAAGGGRVHVVETEAQPIGEIDLVVSLQYDPAAPSMSNGTLEKVKGLFRTTSAVFCDMTDGYFRIGNVRFTRSVGARQAADIVIVDGQRQGGTLGGIGRTGGGITIGLDDGGSPIDATTMAHELGHYVFNLGDEYQVTSTIGPVAFGGAQGLVSLADHTIMELSSDSPSCEVRADPSTDSWADSGTVCASVDDCLTPELLDGVTPVFGAGPEDTVRCQARGASELSVKSGHDPLNGLGTGFDRRLTDGGWGVPDLGATYAEQLHAYTGLQAFCSTDECKLNHCPKTTATQALEVPLTVNTATSSSGPEALPAVGDSIGRAEAETLATKFRTTEVYDNLGRWAVGEETCPEDQDSAHPLHEFLQNLGDVGGDHQWAAWFAMPETEFAGGTDPETLRVVGVYVFSTDDDGETLTHELEIDGLKPNVCLKKVPGSDPRGSEQEPEPLDFELRLSVGAGSSPFIGFARSLGHIGDFAWYQGSLDTCAEVWMPLDDDPLDGLWESTAQSVRHGEWDWSTVSRLFAEYRASDGTTKPFVTFNGSDTLPIVDNHDCYYFQDGDLTKPKGALDVEFDDLTAQGSEVFLVVDRSGSMATLDGEGGETRMANAHAASFNYLKNTAVEAFTAGIPANTGLVWFDDEVACNGPEDDACALGDISNDVTANEIWNNVQLLTPRGSTALVDAVRRAADELDAHAPAGHEKSIYLVSDGHENASVDPDPVALLEDLRGRSISIYALAVGADADAQFLKDLTEHTGGTMFYSPTADFVGNAFQLMETRSKGGAAIIPDGVIISPKYSEYPSYTTFEVNPGAEELVVLLTNGGYAEATDADSVFWDLGIQLTNGTESYMRAGYEWAPEITVVPNRSVKIQLLNPTPGTWSLYTFVPSSTDVFSNLTVTALDADAHLSAGVLPRVVTDGGVVTVEPTVAFGDRPLDSNWAGCEGSVKGPAGFEQALSFEHQPLSVVTGEPPRAVLSSLNGRGFYRVDVRCSVTEDTPPAPNTSAEPLPVEPVTPVPFTLTASDVFYFDTLTMPTDLTGDDDGDSDDDGIVDTLEPGGTFDDDDDGFTGIWDTDSDDDDIDDGTEGTGDTDGDGTADAIDEDSDNDGIDDATETSADADDDGLTNSTDTDSDDDGIDDADEGTGDPDDDGNPNFTDTDSDGDGIEDGDDGCPGFPDPTQPDFDGDGIGDACDDNSLVANAGPDQTKECSGSGKAHAVLDGTGSGAPTGSLSYLWTSSVTLQGATTSIAQGDFPVGATTTVTLKVSQGAVNKSDFALITVVDTTPPALTIPADVVATSCTSVSLGTATAVDACGSTVTITNNAPASYKAGVTFVTWQAVDAFGNLSSPQVQRVNVGLGDSSSCCPTGSNVIVGTSNNDTLTGTSGVDCILGKGAQDTIKGLGGNDILSGGDGDDVIEGGDGSDVISGGTGQDTLRGQNGTDTLLGNDGDDQCYGGASDDVLYGGQGQDKLYGEADNDKLYGDDGDDRLEGAAGNDYLNGGGLHDTCLGGSGTNTLLSCETIQ